jgi:HEAT repeat protein
MKPGESGLFSDLASALVRILPAEEAVAVLIEGADRAHFATQGQALWAMGELGPRAAGAVPALLQAFDDAHKPRSGSAGDGIVYTVIVSLGKIAPKARLSSEMTASVVAAIAKALDLPDDYIRIEAANSLGQFESRAAPALARLHDLQKSETGSQSLRDSVSRAIEKIEPKPDGR